MSYDKVYLSTYEELIRAMKEAENIAKILLGYDVEESAELLSSQKKLKKSQDDLEASYQNLKNHMDSISNDLVNKVTREEKACISMSMLKDEIIKAIEDAASSGGSGGGSSTTGTIETESTVQIDTSEGSIDFGNNTYIVTEGEPTDISNKTYDITTIIQEGGFVWYDTKKDEITPTYNENCVSIGTIWNNGKFPELHINNPDKLLVDGMPISANAKWLNKKLVVLGDNYVVGIGSDKPFYKWLYQLCGFSSITSYAVERSCITPKTEELPAWEDEYQCYLERYDVMDDWYIGAVIIFGGLNDWLAGKELGDINTDDISTFYGATKQLLSEIRTMYPSSRIYFITNPQFDYNTYKPFGLTGTEYEDNLKGFNRKGYTPIQYVNAIVEVCALFGIPCLDLYRNLLYGLSGVLTDGTYGEDGYNGNTELHKIIALKIANFINNN